MMIGWERSSLLAAFFLTGLPAINVTTVLVSGGASGAAVWFSAVVTLVGSYFFLRTPLKPKDPAAPTAWPATAASTLQGSLILIMSTAFLALPDVDPYHWIKAYRVDFLAGDFPPLPFRPLFHSLIHILDTALPLTAEEVFKYALPALSLITLIPAYLIARRLESPAQQLLIMLYPVISPALIISTNMGTPQAVLNITMFFFVSFLMYAYLSRQRVWHYAAGAIMFASIFYHGLALFPFSLWLAATAWHSRYRIVVPLLLAGVAAVSAPYIARYAPSALHDVRLDLTFPVSWTTIDGESAGWPGLRGVVQYYAFYAGPPILALLVLFAWQITQKKVPMSRIKELLSHPSTLTLALTFAVFLSIAEIAPRFLNIAVLPERAWLIVALSSPILFMAMLPRLTLSTYHYAAAFLLLAVSAGGALYVNSLKVHILPNYVVTSARWIGRNIPAEDAVVSNRSPDYLDLYTGSPLRLLPDNFYCEREDADAEQLRDELRARMPHAQYLYLAEGDKRHPYASRRWHEPIETTCFPKALEEDSEYFRSVYKDGTVAGVWKIL